MEGWYYFGVGATILIAVYLIGLLLQRPDLSRERRIAAMLLAWLAFVIYFSWGRDSALFTWIWPHAPVLNVMRVWPRLNIVLVPAITLLLALALSYYLRVLQAGRTGASREPVILLAATAGAILAVLGGQAYFVTQRIFSSYWETYFKLGDLDWPLVRNFDERFFVVMTVLAGALLLAYLLSARRSGSFIATPIVLGGVLAVTFVDLFVLSNFQWSRPYVAQHHTRPSIAAALREDFNRPRVLQSGTVDPFSRVQNVGLVENFGFIRHANFFRRFFDAAGKPQQTAAPDQVAATQRLYGADRRAQRLFVTGRIDYAMPAEFMADVDATAAAANPAIELLG
jgi:hypothetical protein